MPSFEENIRLAVKDSQADSPSANLAERVIFAIDSKRRFYVFIKLAVYSAVAMISSVGLAIVWRIESSSIINSEAIKLLLLLFSDFNVITKYWQDYAFSLLESLPILSMIAVAVFVWVACASLWMVARTYKLFTHRAIWRV
jgi:hypothetical protein